MYRIETPANARSQRTRAALLESARAIIEDGGVKALTMAAVAERARVTRRTAYLHFATRADLLVALFEHVARTEDLAGTLAPVWAAEDAAEALDLWVQHLTRYLMRIARVAQALYRERRTDPDVAAHWKVVSREHRRDCRRLATQLAEADRLSPAWTVRAASDMLWVLMSYDVLSGLVEDRGWSVDQYVGHLQLLLRSTLLVGPDAAVTP